MPNTLLFLYTAGVAIFLAAVIETLTSGRAKLPEIFGTAIFILGTGWLYGAIKYSIFDRKKTQPKPIVKIVSSSLFFIALFYGFVRYGQYQQYQHEIEKSKTPLETRLPPLPPPLKQ